MSFSSPGGGGGSSAPAPHPSFGDKVSTYAHDKAPIMSGLLGALFGGGGHPSGSSVSTDAIPAPQGQTEVQPVQMQQQQMPDYSNMIQMNAKPPESSGGGLKAILKLLVGA